MTELTLTADNPYKDQVPLSQYMGQWATVNNTQANANATNTATQAAQAALPYAGSNAQLANQAAQLQGQVAKLSQAQQQQNMVVNELSSDHDPQSWEQSKARLTAAGIPGMDQVGPYGPQAQQQYLQKAIGSKDMIDKSLELYGNQLKAYLAQEHAPGDQPPTAPPALNALTGSPSSAPLSNLISPSAASSPTTPITGKPLQAPNNNPGNLRPVGATNGFQSFNSPQAGVQALDSDLSSKISGSSPAMAAKLGKNYTPTISSLISVYAPANENDTAAYIADVAKQMGKDPNAPLTAADEPALRSAIIAHEQGANSASSYQTADSGQTATDATTDTSAPADSNAPTPMGAANSPQADQGSGTIPAKPNLSSSPAQMTEAQRYSPLSFQGEASAKGAETGAQWYRDNQTGQRVQRLAPGVAIFNPDTAKDLHGTAYLQTLAPQDKAYISDIANYNQPIMNTRTASSGLALKDITAAVKQANPDWKQSGYDAMVSFNNGADADKVASFSTAAQHLELLKTTATALQNGNKQAINRISNDFREAFGQAPPTDLATVNRLVAGEVANVVSGGNGGTGEDRKGQQETGEDYKSPAQLYGAIDKTLATLKGRVDSSMNKYEDGTNRTDFYNILAPNAQKAFNIIPTFKSPTDQNYLNMKPGRYYKTPSGQLQIKAGNQ